MSSATIEKYKLGLNLPSDPRWVNIAEKSIEDILIDHAFCEQKAASTGISLIVHFSDKKELVEAITPIVAEEWDHFGLVLKELKLRGFELGKKRKDDYAIALFKLERTGGARDAQLVEKLLISAMIEARSCERFRLLSLHINDDRLKKFYHGFMVSEAGHYKTFLGLAKFYMPADYVSARWKEYLIAEAEIMRSMEMRADRFH